MLEDFAVFGFPDDLLLRRLEIVEYEEFRLFSLIVNRLHVTEMRLLDHLLAEATLGLATLMPRLSFNDFTTLASEHLRASRNLKTLLLVLVLKEFSCSIYSKDRE